MSAAAPLLARKVSFDEGEAESALSPARERRAKHAAVIAAAAADFIAADKKAQSMRRVVSEPSHLNEWVYETRGGMLEIGTTPSCTDVAQPSAAASDVPPASPSRLRRHRRVASEGNLSSLATAARSVDHGLRWEAMVAAWEGLPPTAVAS